MNLFSNRSSSDTSSTVSNTPSPEAAHEPHPLIEIIRFSVIALLIVIPVRLFIAQPFIVSGASMQDTFHNGEYLIVDQLSYHLNSPARGDVVVFRYPRDPSKYFIKRVIGVPGDTITVEGSTVSIANETHPDGLVLNEPYIKSMKPGVTIIEELGDREYFVMGDNRDQSSDSRVWGVLQEENIVGRAYLRLYPIPTLDYLPGVSSEAIIMSDS